MDLRAITDLEGGRLQSDAGSQNEPWDPGVSVTRRQVPTHTPAAPAPPPSAPADGRHYTSTRHKDRGDLMPRVSKGKRSDAAGHRVVSPNYNEDGSELPFVPHHASLDPPVPHPSDPHTTQPANLSSGHPASRAAHMVANPGHRTTSDRNRGMGISTTASAQKGIRRERRREDDDTDAVGDRERYRSRPRHRSTEPDPQLNVSIPDSPRKLPPRHHSLPFPSSPDSDSASSQRPTTTELASNASPRHNFGRDLDRDGPDQPAPGCDETRMQRSPTRGGYHPAGVQPAHLQPSGFSGVRSSSVESVEERDENPSPHLQLQPVQNTLPTVSSASASAPQPAPNAGNFGMLSDSELADETVHLRALLGCPPGAPVGLSALADPPPGEKPNYPLPTLIKLAIYGSPRRRLTLQEIYQALEDRFEWFRQRTDELSWKNSIRHNLSLRKCFLKVQRPITEPGKGSYWMIDLTQGEGNKRVRKRNKKPTKGQLAAQVAAEAYRASARLPGQGDGPRPVPYPTMLHTDPQPQIAEEGCGEDSDDYQAPPMQTNFETVVNSLHEEQPHHHSLHRGSLTTATTQQQHLQPSGTSISSRQLHGHQNAAQPLPFSSSHDTLGPNPRINPTLRPILSKDGLSHHAIRAPVTAASPHDILFSRGQSVSGTPQILQQVSGSPEQAQLTLPLPPSHPTYHHQLLSHQGKGSHASTSRAVPTPSHIPQRSQQSPSLLQQQLQSDTPRQMQRATSPKQPTIPTQTQLQPTRLPPMRMLCESPVTTTPSLSLQQQPTPPTQSSTHRQQQGPIAATTSTSGFARFASPRGSTGFGAPTFNKSALGGDPPNRMPIIRPLVLSEDKGKRRATESEGRCDSAGDNRERGREGRDTGGEGGSRRHFVPPPPRSGVEYVQRADGGLITARRTSGRHDEGSIGWLNRFDRGEANRGDDSGGLSPQEDAT